MASSIFHIEYSQLLRILCTYPMPQTGDLLHPPDGVCKAFRGAVRAIRMSFMPPAFRSGRKLIRKLTDSISALPPVPDPFNHCRIFHFLRLC